MTPTALRSKLTLAEGTFVPPQEELLPLKWSIVVWLFLAATSWGGVYFMLSLLL